MSINQHVVEKKYHLQDIASRIQTDSVFTTDKEKKRISKGKLPRICHCHKTRTKRPSNGKFKTIQEGVAILKAKDTGSAFYKGLQTCGSWSVCPICSPKIGQAKTGNIDFTFKKWLELNREHSILFCTFTVPHYSDYDLIFIRESFMKARRLLKQQKPLKRTPLVVFQELSKNYGIYASISAIEAPFNFHHGWNPHSHDLFFMTRKLTKKEFKTFNICLKKAWLYAVKRAGLRFKREIDVLKNGVKLEKAHKSASYYISKFGIEDFENNKDTLGSGWGSVSELTKSHLKNKKDSKKGYSPWAMLQMIADNPGDMTVFNVFGSRIKEFTNVFKGKKQIFYSKGFKTMIGLVEKSDQEIVEEDIEEAKLYGFITPRMWNLVKKLKLRGRIIVLSEKLNYDQLLVYIKERNREYEKEKKLRFKKAR